MRIGTWNLADRWSDAHAALFEAADCEVWLLTEVSDRLELPGYVGHRTEGDMAARRSWAAILSRGSLTPLPDPHPASAMAVVGGTTYLCSVLPWRSCGADPWGEGPHAARTERAVAEIEANLPGGPLVWGGDWNHALDGEEFAGSQGGRRAVLTALERLDLQIPTRHLAAAGGGLSIDHVVISARLEAHAERIEAGPAAARLSDHDLYVVDVRR